MNSVKSFDGNASERDVLVDDIQRIREVLHLGGDKLSSDDEEEEEDSEEEEFEDEENLFRGTTPWPGKSQNQSGVSSIKQNGRICFLGDPAEGKREEAFDSFRRETADNSNQCIPDKPGNEHYLQEQHSVFPDEHMNVDSNVYTLTELQPVKFQPTDRFLSISQRIQDDPEWQMEPTVNLLPQQNQTEKEEQAFSVRADISDDDSKMKRELQECLESNRDYQLAVLDELERIELALAKNREKQLGLHQMRASREEIKAEPHTLIAFSNPYFRDKHGVGPPDNEDTKSKRRNAQVGGYELPAKSWTTREKEALAAGVRMQNLESKLSPVLQKIRKLESKKSKTAEDLKELELLHSEKSRIKNIPRETLERDLDGIDWDKISSTYLQKRSGFECRLRWCNFGHPDVNLTPWTKEEDKILIQLAKSNDTWDFIAQKLQTNRTPIHCYQRYQRSLNKNLLKSKWTPEDDQRLLEIVRVLGEGHWSRVAGFMDGRMGDQCMHRYMQTLKLVKRGKWSEEEDELLWKAVEKFGPANWYKMAELVPGRTGSQCRERWVNALDPKISKGDWAKEEDNRLINNVDRFGLGNWAKIARAQGNRTDNQCWRRWIVLRKEDSLHYRQNILRKRRELVANFTGRKQERPSLQPEDLDIPDLPVVRKHSVRHPVPPKESRQRRELTRVRYKEKKPAEKRETEKIPKERAPRTRRVVRYMESSDSSEEDSEELVLSDDDESNEASETSSSSDEEQEETKKNSRRTVNGGSNRSGAQQSRVITQSKEVSSQKEAEGAGAENKVPVSGSLAPFSLLLQAFSIDIPTVLQTIQRGSSAQSLSPSPAGADAAATQGTPAVAKAVDRVGDQSLGNGFSGVRTSSVPGSPQGEITGVVPEDLRQDDERHNKSVSQKGGSNLVEDAYVGKQGIQKSNEKYLTKDLSCENETSPDTVKFDREDLTKVSSDTNKDATPVPNTRAQESVKTPPRRAPVIPPLPPCCTTLKTFRSLQQLRPHLEQLAAMLHGPRGENAMVTRPTTSATFSPVSNVNVTHDNVERSRESVRDHHVVSSECNKNGRGTEPNHVEYSLSNRCGNTADSGGGVCGACQENSSNNTESSSPFGSTLVRDPSSSGNVSSCVQGGAVATAPAINFTSNHGNETTFASVSATKTAAQGTVQNSEQGFTGIGLLGSNVNKSLYQNTYAYKLLSSRFNSLFLWPALLSTVSPHVRYQAVSTCHTNTERQAGSRMGPSKNSAVSKGQKRKSQMGDGSTPLRRKRRGLAAVRMASSASMGTIAQQMITEGQGSMIRAAAPATRAAHTSSVNSSAGDTSAARDSTIGVRSGGINTDSDTTEGSQSSNDSVKPKRTTAPLETRRSSRIKAYSSRQTFESGARAREDRGLGSSQNEKTTDLVNGSSPSSLPKSPRPTTSRSVSSPPGLNSQGFSPKRSCGSSCTPSVVSCQNTDNLRRPQTVGDQETEHDCSNGTPAHGSETADAFAGEAANRLSPRTRKNVALSPGSSKRKTSTPRRRSSMAAGARWRAMLPSTEEEEEEEEDSD